MISLVTRSTDDVIQINCQRAELNGLEPYNFVEFIDAQETPSEESVIFWPYVNPETHRVAIEGKQISPHELVFRRGASIQATDGEIGMMNFWWIPKAGISRIS